MPGGVFVVILSGDFRFLPGNHSFGRGQALYFVSFRVFRVLGGSLLDASKIRSTKCTKQYKKSRFARQASVRESIPSLSRSARPECVALR